MLDILFRIGAALAAGWAVNEGVKALTGSSIPQHLLRLWNSMREKCLEWLRHQPKSVQNVVKFGIVRTDKIIQRAANVCNIIAYNEKTEEVTVVSVEKLTEEELEELNLIDEVSREIKLEV